MHSWKKIIIQNNACRFHMRRKQDGNTVFRNVVWDKFSIATLSKARNSHTPYIVYDKLE